MIYYEFTCESCGHKRTFNDTAVINHLIDQGYHKCGICDHRTSINPDEVVKDDKPEPVGYYPENTIYHGYDGKDFPSINDMDVFSADLEDNEDWQQLILEEFGESDDLTRDDKYGYDDALSQLKSHQFGWVKFGVWAFRFKVKRFYKRHHKTWKQFCEKVLHKSHWAVDKIIKATRVIKDLLCAGFEVLPENEYQCRFLAKFWGEELIDNWTMIVDAVPPHLITGDLIKSQFAIKEPKEEKWVKVNSQLWEEFQHKAHSRGLNPNHVIEDYLNEWEGDENEETTDELEDDQVEDVPIEKLKAWEDDLQALIEEKDRADNWFTKLIFWSLTNERNTGFLGIP